MNEHSSFCVEGFVSGLFFMFSVHSLLPCALSRKHYPLCMFAIFRYIFFYNYHLLHNYFLKPLQGGTVRVLFGYYHTVYETIRSGRFKVVTVQGNRKP